jgi:hypothetical protein
MRMSFVTDSNVNPRERTKVAWALEQLILQDSLTDQVELKVVDLELPTGRTVQSPALHAVHGDRVFVAMLAPATHCWATDISSGKREKHDVRSLDGAVIDRTGHATILAGSHLRAIEMIPCWLPNPSPLDWRIIHALIGARKAKKQCYRSVLEGIPPGHASQLPLFAKVRGIDCSRLSKLKPKLLKQYLHAVREQDPGLQISEEKLAQTLAMFGIRPRETRRRIA